MSILQRDTITPKTVFCKPNPKPVVQVPHPYAAVVRLAAFDAGLHRIHLQTSADGPVVPALKNYKRNAALIFAAGGRVPIAIFDVVLKGRQVTGNEQHGCTC